MDVDVEYLASESWDAEMPERARWLEGVGVGWAEERTQGTTQSAMLDATTHK